MMKWMVVISEKISDQNRHELFDNLSITYDSDDSGINLDDENICYIVEGPNNLHELCESFSEIKGVYPDSEISLFHDNEQERN